MAWITLTEADVLRKLAAPELDAARTAAIADGQADPLPGVISEITLEVRSRVAACDRNILGEGVTIPDECSAAALARIRFELATRLPGGGGLLDEDRRKANDNALSFLRDVAACDVAIVPPETAAPEQAGSGNAQVISGTCRKFTRQGMSGL